jgi:signal transduction histidine kinase
VNQDPNPRGSARLVGFRAKLFLATMLVVSATALLVLFFAERRMVISMEQDLQLEFQGALAGVNNAEEARQALIVDRCRALARRPRIHAALEDAPELLYPSAQDELNDLMNGAESGDQPAPAVLRAEFYRFLGPDGRVIPSGNSGGALQPSEEAQLGLPALPQKQETGFLIRTPTTGGENVCEIIATPIISAETGEVIAALVLGIEPFRLGVRQNAGIHAGIWYDGRLHLPSISAAAGDALTREISSSIAGPSEDNSLRFQASGGDAQYLVFYRRLNPGSVFRPAYEVCIYPMTELAARKRHLRWEVLGSGAALLLGAFGASHMLARRLSKPVEILAEESERSARFSADASHQLKTPVAVLRAGLEELMSHEHFTEKECAEISALIHQTYRLSSLIGDLLLLSRMDAGRLKIDLQDIDLRLLLETCLDDLSTLPDHAAVDIQVDIDGKLSILGDKGYTAIILQNLLENARKYNRPGGRIRVAAWKNDKAAVIVSIGNTGPVIPAEAQAHVFERFHRARIGEDVPGYGLGLNLARELARLHKGGLRLVRSEGDWTEFEAHFQASPSKAGAPSQDSGTKEEPRI